MLEIITFLIYLQDKKKDGTYRVILNFKALNCEIEKHHFKMETLKSALQCI